MKDKVFIGWSGTNIIALKVKKILEEEYNYICSIGGNSDNSSRFASVGDTVIQQIKNCNQAIVIFQNRVDGAISNNLFFELGYVFSLYGAKKVHCVKKDNEDVVLPSDFDNSFVESIDAFGDNSEDKFAKGIVEYFISRQKMTITENKMYLIDNRYIIHDKIASHYSEYGSKCSDYELAQYILFYMQAAYMFGDEEKICKELTEFKNAHNNEFSHELNIAVSLSLTYFHVLSKIKAKEETKDVYIDPDDFFDAKEGYEFCEKNLIKDTINGFYEWANLFITQHLSFIYMIYGNNPNLSLENKKEKYVASCRYSMKSLENIKELKEKLPRNENNDDSGILSLLRAYIYRNIYICKKHIGEDDYLDWLEKTYKERLALKNLYSEGSIDSELYNNFAMEYYLALVSYLSYYKEFDMDSEEVFMYKRKINKFLKSMEEDDKKNFYLEQINEWCNNKL